MKRAWALVALLLMVLGLRGAAWAETDSGPREISQAAYIANLGRLQALVAACETKPGACDGKLVGEDQRVSSPVQGGSFVERWDWLRSTLNAARDPRLEDRAETLAQAQARLVAERADASGAGDEQPEVSPAAARAKAEAILHGSEFSRVPQQENYLEEKLALLRLWVSRLLMGAAILVPHSAWAGLALEWGAVGLAAAGLMVWAFRVSRQQRVAITVPRPPDAGWEKESDDWAERARTAAAKGEWREAVHCVYWAAIVMLEGQRLWRANRARTPREYVRLLEPGSAKRTALGGLTGVFERIWYGLRPAAEQDYRQADALLAQLKGHAQGHAQGGSN